MLPRLALASTLAFIAFLFWRDARTRPRLSGALWLPIIWFFLVCSRYLSQWLALWGVPVGPVSQEDGSPIDAVVFGIVISLGVIVLVRRKVALFTLVRNNWWLTIFLAYSFLAIAWSDFPFVAFKRWIKELGHPVMALIVLSDPEGREAVRAVLRRTSYLLIPPCILTIKYFPEIGRGFDNWTGAATNFGIASSKNELGYVCALLGLFFAWNLLSIRRTGLERHRRAEIALTSGFLLMIGWLLSMAQSSTAIVCTLIGVLTMAIVSTPLVGRFTGTFVAIGFLLVVTADSAFGLYDRVVEDVLGEDATLTDRTGVWQDAIALVDRPLVGAGFESFWLGSRLDTMWMKWWWRPTQAHNGYIETYLNLGWLGVAILVALLVMTFRKARIELLRDVDFGRFRLAVLFAIIAYNYTEATFKALHPLWTLFYLIATDLPSARDSRARGQTVSPPLSTSPARRFEVPARHPLAAAQSSRHSRHGSARVTSSSNGRG